MLAQENTRTYKTQEERKEDACARIIDAAFSCFGTLGYQQTTLTDIANKAGCSRELPRYHFGSKEGLVSALLDETLRSWRDVFEAATADKVYGSQALCRVVDAFATKYVESSPLLRGQLALIFGAADPGNSILRSQVVAIQRASQKSFKQIIERGMGDNGSAEPFNIEARATLLYSAFRGFAYQWMTDEDGTDIGALSNELKILITLTISPYEKS